MLRNKILKYVGASSGDFQLCAAIILLNYSILAVAASPLALQK